MNKRILSVSLLGLLSLSACVNPGDKYRPDVFDASDVNRAQAHLPINITSISPVKIRVDNTSNQKTAETAGGVIGGGTGAGLGTAFGGTLGGVAGGLGGALVGAIAGGLSTNKNAMVDGVSISYSFADGSGSLAATEVGKPCHWQTGPAQLIVLISSQTGAKETRVLANSSCKK